jgi:hypothetical protein
LNGHVSPAETSTPETRTERTSRLRDRPNISVAELAAMQRGYVERLGRLIEQLAAVMSRQNPPTAAIGSPATAHAGTQDDVDRAVIRYERSGKLTRTLLADGSVGYTLGTDLVRSTVARFLGEPSPAFIERGAAMKAPYLEILGTKDHEIAAAMAFAAQRWGKDEIVIHVGGRHTSKIIGHAVAQGLNIANPDAYVQSLVAQERARRADPAARRFCAASTAGPVAVIEQASSAPHRSR